MKKAYNKPAMAIESVNTSILCMSNAGFGGGTKNNGIGSASGKSGTWEDDEEELVWNDRF